MLMKWRFGSIGGAYQTLIKFALKKVIAQVLKLYLPNTQKSQVRLSLSSHFEDASWVTITVQKLYPTLLVIRTGLQLIADHASIFIFILANILVECALFLAFVLSSAIFFCCSIFSLLSWVLICVVSERQLLSLFLPLFFWTRFFCCGGISQLMRYIVMKPPGCESNHCLTSCSLFIMKEAKNARSTKKGPHAS